jgi:phospholipase/carboxylesterase
VTADDHPARLRARPRPPAEGVPLPAPGRTPLGLGRGRDGLLHVPAAVAEGAPLPLMVVLHGAGSSATRAIDLMAGLADEAGIILLAPDSRGTTWDVIRGGFGPDVAFLDLALEQVLSSCPVDPARVALEGFSDGASYALSLGVGNGDLFTHLLAFSPGFAAPAGQVGRPRVLVTHGVHDAVLPIDRCSRRLVPALREAGYDVTYEEFDGGHVVPPELARTAVSWVG